MKPSTLFRLPKRISYPMEFGAEAAMHQRSVVVRALAFGASVLLAALPAQAATSKGAVQVSAGGCARLHDGSVKCWGGGWEGRTGLGDTSPRGDQPGEMGHSLPVVDLGTGRTALAIGTGYLSNCAVLSDGSVKCWGYNNAGQLGLGDTASRGDGPGEMGDNLPHVDLGTARTALAIDTGGYHSCAILDDGAVKCWGDNGAGQLGLSDTTNRGDGPGEMGDALPAVDLGTGRSAIAVSTGINHTCAVLDDGSVKCWGGNDAGQLGLGDATNHGDGPGEMGDNLPAIGLGTGRSAVAISAGHAHTCAILDNGSVKCWGGNGEGQLGLGDTASRGDGPGEMGDSLPAVDLGAGRTAVRISAGGNDTCAILDDGSAKCWGDNFYGQLGLGDMDHRGDRPGEMGDRLRSVLLGTGRRAIEIAAGGASTCALLEGGVVKCWGFNDSGDLGLGDIFLRGRDPGEMGDHLPAVDLGAGRPVVALGAGDAHSCAVLNDGAVKCWGSNGSGRLGLGDTVKRGSTPADMGGLLPDLDLGTGRSATEVDVGAKHACAILDDGSMKCWGDNGSGRLGLGDTAGRGDRPGEMGDALPAVDTGSGRHAIAVSAGDAHTCAILDDGSTKCWGNNGSGRLGLGDTVKRGDGPGEMGDALPVLDLGAGHTAVALDAGAKHNCAILDDGSVKCWGDNGSGRLGLGDTAKRGDEPGEMGDALPAVDLGTGRSATAITLGDAHSCAILDDASVKCWGDNGSGRLGLGDTAKRGDGPGEMGDALPAVDLGTGRTAVAIDAGAKHTCAILDDGSVKCWGDNGSGRLGLGDTAKRGDGPGQMGDALPAVDLGTGRTATSVTVGDAHACALLDDGSTRCWGNNGAGRLGLGDTAKRGDAPGEMGDLLPAVSVD